ncbi:hypothetical protein IAD21_01130 [Abditibacteriota bacterium]|nr:hypothetical protein IAD21_01130 [Abditibacteriota bacterium]
MNEPFYNVLLKAREGDMPVAIYCNPDNPRAFLAGWVEAVSETHVILRHLSPEGRYDGYVLKYCDSIFRVDTEGRYLERLAFLFSARKQKFPSVLVSDYDAQTNLIIEILLAAQREDLLVTVEVAAEDFDNGAVKSVEMETMTLEVFDPYGVIDREATIHLEAISEVRVDSERLQSLKLLSNWHQLPGL